MTLQPVLYKANMIREMRRFLHDEGFFEMSTPVVRQHDCGGYSPRVRLAGGKYLRESPAGALRYNLAYADRIFEIGPCFRDDAPDATHLGEFTMLDLYARGETCATVRALAKRLVSRFYAGSFEELSVAGVLRARFGVDFFNDPEADQRLSCALAPISSDSSQSYEHHLDEFIKREIEPASAGRCLIVTDFPLAAESHARRRNKTVLAERFEFQIDGVEVVHGYEDEPDLDELGARSRNRRQFGPEDKIILDEISRGFLPPQSAGFGIGVERLCSVCVNAKDIREFTASRPFGPGGTR